MKKTTKWTALSITICIALGSIAVGLMPLVSAQDTPFTDLFEFNINHHPSVSFWGVPSDSAVGTPGWHMRAAFVHLLDKQEFLSMLSGKTLTDNPVSQFNTHYLNWTPDLLDQVDQMPGHVGSISLYNEVAMASDFCAARDHLVATGLFVDRNHDCVIDGQSIPTSQITLYSRSDDPERDALGAYVENRIETLFGGADVVNRIEISFQQAQQIVFDTTVPNDWHLYTAGFHMQTHGFGLLCSYETQSANYNFYSNPDFDNAGCTGQSVTTAQFIFGETIGSIPVWTEP